MNVSYTSVITKSEVENAWGDEYWRDDQTLLDDPVLRGGEVQYNLQTNVDQEWIPLGNISSLSNSDDGGGFTHRWDNPHEYTISNRCGL